MKVNIEKERSERGIFLSFACMDNGQWKWSGLISFNVVNAFEGYFDTIDKHGKCTRKIR